MKLSQATASRLRRVMGILATVLTLTVGVLFIAACCYLNGLGQSPFTYENIRMVFSAISIPVYITLAVIVVGVIINLILPMEEGKLKVERDTAAILRRLRAERDESQLSQKDAESVSSYRKTRRVLLITNIILFAVGTLVGIIVGAIVPFAEVVREVKVDYNALTVRAVIILALSLIPAVALAVTRAIVDESLREREIALIRPLPKVEKITVNATPCVFKRYEREIILGVRITLFGAAIMYIIVGILNGGMADVLEKAVKICTECIGLG